MVNGRHIPIFVDELLEKLFNGENLLKTNDVISSSSNKLKLLLVTRRILCLSQWLPITKIIFG